MERTRGRDRPTSQAGEGAGRTREGVARTGHQGPGRPPPVPTHRRAGTGRGRGRGTGDRWLLRRHFLPQCQWVGAGVVGVVGAGVSHPRTRRGEVGEAEAGVGVGAATVRQRSTCVSSGQRGLVAGAVVVVGVPRLTTAQASRLWRGGWARSPGG